MSVLINKVEMQKFDKVSIPRVVTLSFTNGEVCTYDKRNEWYSSQGGPNNREPMFTYSRYSLSDWKREDSTFEAMLNTHALQLEALEKQYDSFSKEMAKNYQGLKQKLESRVEEHKVPAKKIETIIKWSRETNVDELLEAAKMLESEAEYIVKKVRCPKLIYDVFLSGVQKNLEDITDSLQKKGLKVCFDKSAGGLDNQSTIDGIVDSCSFAIILTHSHFQKSSNVFQYFISIIAGKSVIPAYEIDPRYGGGYLESYKLPKMFQKILTWEPLQVSRKYYWEAFITALYLRINKTLFPMDRYTLAQRVWLESELKNEGFMIGDLLFASLRDGNTAKAFHTKCDGQGSTLVVIEDKDKRFFGGFTSGSWVSSSGGYWSNCASVWLFTQDSEGSLKRIDIKSDQRNYSIYSNTNCGPTFGIGHDLAIIPGGQSYCSHSSFQSPVLAVKKFAIKHYEVYKVVKLVL